MATTVNSAFVAFMTNYVNIDKDVVSAARKSRDNLLDNISEFDDDEFFGLWSQYNVHFGSFARKTKCRDLDDIDLMIGISANGATYNEHDSWNNVRITASASDQAQISCTRDDGTLNSTQVINLFKKKLQNVREYSRSDIHKDGEAIVLNLTSYEWSFDIVPCFYTVPDRTGRNFYLIPNGKGNWKKTDPRIDRDRVSAINQQCNGYALDVIRLVKYWCKHSVSNSIPSYLLEAMILDFCENNKVSNYVNLAFQSALDYIIRHVYCDIADPKGIQGNINSLSLSQKLTLYQHAQLDYSRAFIAWQYEKSGDIETAIDYWRKVFGNEFPTYG